jgi:hypothetical protein
VVGGLIFQSGCWCQCLSCSWGRIHLGLTSQIFRWVLFDRVLDVLWTASVLRARGWRGGVNGSVERNKGGHVGNVDV